MHAIYSAAHLRHDPAIEVDHGVAFAMFELPSRAETILKALQSDARFAISGPSEHGVSAIEAVHDPAMVAFLGVAWQEVSAELAAAGDSITQAIPDVMLHPALRDGMGPVRPPASAQGRLGYWCFETTTPIVEGTYAAARDAVDCALTATDLVLGGEQSAYALCRPPGHHAARTLFGGYCYFNNAAIAAHHAINAGCRRVAVLDVDYHHGNGTQQIFYRRADVLYVSLHGDPDRAYPYFAGHADEEGAGSGSGANLNLPLALGCDDSAYLRELQRACEVIDAFRPELVVVSLGVDTFHNDPLGDLALSQESFGAAGAMVAGLGRPVVVVQEGGYDIPALGANVHAWLLPLVAS
jgi:acetoin utilization deacetylase AcuC-like enzyme